MCYENVPLVNYLREKGIKIDDLIATALELFSPHPGVETREKASELLREGFMEALSDVNVSCLIVAGFLLEAAAENGKVPGLTSIRLRSPGGIVADELLGINIATYIAGARGLFEFVRFDQIKPGILKNLGPFVNDAIGGLIAGVSSNMYTRASKQNLI
ncbi:MAG: phosphatidylglycerophosphatase A [Candidatus Bathyarchaeota archaeon]|nr:phosphatidylglycerophosphatase A [Candidatus Bathyarchaeota archaeon]